MNLNRWFVRITKDVELGNPGDMRIIPAKGKEDAVRIATLYNRLFGIQRDSKAEVGYTP